MSNQKSGVTTKEPLMTPAEVAALFRVGPKTATRWAERKKLHSIKTAGGHRRFRESEVEHLLEHGFECSCPLDDEGYPIPQMRPKNKAA